MRGQYPRGLSLVPRMEVKKRTQMSTLSKSELMADSGSHVEFCDRMGITDPGKLKRARFLDK